MRKIFTLSLLFLYFTAFNQHISSPNVNEVVGEKDDLGNKTRYISDSEFQKSLEDKGSIYSDPNTWFRERMKNYELRRTNELLNLIDTEISSLPIHDKALLMAEYGRTKNKRIQKKIENILLTEIFKDDGLLLNDEYEFLNNVYNSTQDENIKSKIQNIFQQKKIKEEESFKEANEIVEMFRAEQEEKKQIALEKKKAEELKKIVIEGIPIFVIIFLLFTLGMWRLYKNREPKQETKSKN